MRLPKNVNWKNLFPAIFGLAVITLVVIAIPIQTQLAGRATGTPANLVINYEGVLGKMPTPWRNLAQGGEEPKEMLGGVVEEIKLLKPEYIRLDHIYDAYKVVNRDDQGKLIYDWQALDHAVDVILSTGAKPFLALSYMPEVISQGDMVSPAKDWNEWGEVTRATIEHYSGKSGKNIKDVIYEVWNEPDLFGGYKTYPPKNYFDMYEASARGAARAQNVNNFEIGGPAATALYQNWVEKLIKFVGEKKLRLDFVSWHRYSKDLSQFEKDAKDARSWAEKIPALVDLKFYVTEWGFDSEVNKDYDTTFGAIHTIAATRAMMGAVDKTFIFEIKDGLGQAKYWGRWGLLTNESFGKPEKKPRFLAIDFMNELEPYRLSVQGEGSWVKAIASLNDDGNMKILVVNYDPNSRHAENFPLRIDNLPKGEFTYTRKDFLGTSRTEKIATNSASFAKNENLEPNSAMMISVDF